VIVGCGRVGAGIADLLAAAGHEVTILDITTDAFARLDPGFPGNAVRGDGTDEDVLRRAGAEGADNFFALTEGDNRNVLAAQLATERLHVRNVVAKVNDPVRANAYAALGLAALCRTTMMIDALSAFAGVGDGIQPQGVIAATGSHPGGDHHLAPASAGTRAQLTQGRE
jgi:trk system potassium uptake protein TrkA